MFTDLDRQCVILISSDHSSSFKNCLSQSFDSLIHTKHRPHLSTSTNSKEILWFLVHSFCFCWSLREAFWVQQSHNQTTCFLFTLFLHEDNMFKYRWELCRKAIWDEVLFLWLSYYNFQRENTCTIALFQFLAFMSVYVFEKKQVLWSHTTRWKSNSVVRETVTPPLVSICLLLSVFVSSQTISLEWAIALRWPQRTLHVRLFSTCWAVSQTEIQEGRQRGLQSLPLNQSASILFT